MKSGSCPHKIRFHFAVPYLGEFFTSCLERSTPEFSVRSKPGHQHVQLISLRECHRPIVEHPLDLRFEPGAGFERRTLGRSVEIDIEVDLQTANVILKSANLLLEICGFF